MFIQKTKCRIKVNTPQQQTTSQGFLNNCINARFYDLSMIAFHAHKHFQVYVDAIVNLLHLEKYFECTKLICCERHIQKYCKECNDLFVLSSQLPYLQF